MHRFIPGSAGPEFSRETWLSVKYTLGLAFPNVRTHSLISSPGDRNGNVLYSFVHKHYVACRHCLYHCSQLPYLIDGDIKMTQSNAVSSFTIATLSVSSVHVASSPGPSQIPWLRDKIWEWPGDEATVHA